MAIFFAEKLQGNLQKMVAFFVNFSVSLTNDIISFEQLGLGVVCDFLGLVVQN